MPFLEIACFNPQSALVAAKAGASRIELCANASAGGLTPPLAELRELKEDPSVTIPIYVMIRPHDRSFTLTLAELSSMEEEIRAFNREGADGYVFGALTEHGAVDEEKCRVLIDAAGGRPCTFHRAFDALPEDRMEEELEKLVSCGFENVLTSGGMKSASEGKEALRRLVTQAGNRIVVIVGGGVRSSNAAMLRECGASSFHSSAIVSTDGGEIANTEEIQSLTRILEE